MEFSKNRFLDFHFNIVDVYISRISSENLRPKFQKLSEIWNSPLGTRSDICNSRLFYFSKKMSLLNFLLTFCLTICMKLTYVLQHWLAQYIP